MSGLTFDPAMVAFVFATTAFPGPNAVLMLALGTRSDIRTGVHILLGLAVGNGAVKGAIAAGMRWAAALDPRVIEVAQVAAAAIMIWFVIRILRGNQSMHNTGAAHVGALMRTPLQLFMDGVGFQLCNPKVWITGAAAAALFCDPALDEVGHAMTFAIVAFPSVMVGAGIWLLVGRIGSQWLNGARTIMAINATLAIMLAATVVPVLAW